MIIKFKSQELTVFKDRIEKESTNLIAKIIKKHCPISIGEKVRTFAYFNEVEWLIVSKISLMAIDSWNYHGDRLSFEYEGIPLKKNGVPMKNRKPKWFGCFEKNDKIYHTPSYSRIAVVPANMYSK